MTWVFLLRKGEYTVGPQYGTHLSNDSTNGASCKMFALVQTTLQKQLFCSHPPAGTNHTAKAAVLPPPVSIAGIYNLK